jgi:hypothetical protein
MSRGWLLLCALTAALLMPHTARAGAACAAARAEERCDKNNAVCCDEPIWGIPHALTAISQLPSVRVIVYDPVSNSFAFVRPCKAVGGTGTCAKNMETLDRHRLALTVQKIRLLIMPYNPLDGDLTLDVTDGKGIEFAEIASTGAVTTTTTPAAATGAAGAKPASESPRPKTQKPPVTAQIRALDHGPSDPRQAAVGRVAANVTEYENTALPAVRRKLGEFHDKADCARDHLQDVALQVSIAFAECHFSLAQDRSLDAIISEANRRSDAIKNAAYNSCFQSGNTLDDDVQTLRGKSLEATAALDHLNTLLEARSSDLDYLTGQSAPPKFPGDWRGWMIAQKKDLDEDRTEVDQLIKEHQDVDKQVAQLRTDDASQRRALSSPARELQRRDYPPLENGGAKTFVIKRGKTVQIDGVKGKAATPTPVATLVLNSAPTYTLRFGTGVVVSGLRNPTFKVVDETGLNKTKAASDQTPDKTIEYSDRGKSEVLPALFVHHYWLRRSGLLTPTWFERLVPTFSLGIPLAKTDTLEQVLLGFDWELVPGVEINAGAHWAKRNSLIKGVAVGHPIPGTLDLSNVQETRFGASFYAGIVLNGDSFATFTGGQKK